MRAVLGSILQRRKLLVITGLVIAFLLALIIWSLGPATHHLAAPNGTTFQLPSDSASPSSSSSSAKPAASGLPPGFSFPESVLEKAGGAGRHSVTLEATSNGRILRMGYIIAGAHPDRGKAVVLASPFELTTVGRSDSVIALFGVQASPEDTYITCKITVDGKVRTQKTVYGPWKWVVCLG